MVAITVYMLILINICGLMIFCRSLFCSTRLYYKKINKKKTRLYLFDRKYSKKQYYYDILLQLN